MKKIVVVDNHPVVLKFMTNLITKDGHDVKTAHDGLAALKIIKDAAPDIAFIDLVMPNISGDKLCRIVREMPELNNVFLVILSAIAAEDITPFSEYGANACIAKGPFNKMSEHVLSIINHPDLWNAVDLKDKIIGKEDIYNREITRELLASKRHYQATLNNISEGILELTAESKVVFINPAAISIIGITEEILLSSDFSELFQENDQPVINDSIHNSFTRGESVSLDDPIQLGARFVTIKIIPILEENQNRLLIVLHDATERAITEKVKQENQKLKNIVELSDAARHDLNEPLMAIIGYSELLILSKSKDDPLYAYIEKIAKQIEKIKAITKKRLNTIQ